MKLIIDCNYVCHRAFHSVKNLSHNQRQVGVIFGFIKQIFALSEKFKSRDFIFCWDSRKSYRGLIYPDYKKNRQQLKETEEEQVDRNQAYDQFDELRTEILPYMGFKNIFHQTGYEGDDLIAFVSMRIPDQYTIVTADEDLLQLIVRDRFCPVDFYNFKAITTYQNFTDTWYGLTPFDFAKIKAIAGCHSDNVAGITGIGETTAAKYLAGLRIGPAAMKKIELEKDRFLKINLPLVSLPFQGRKPIKIDGIVDEDLCQEQFSALFGQYGFRSLLTEEAVKKWSKFFDKERTHDVKGR